MEQGMVSPTNGKRLRPAIPSKPFVSHDQLLFPLPYHMDGGDLFGLYSPVFSPEKGTPTAMTPLPGSAPLSLTSSSVSFDEEELPAATERRLYMARLTLQYQEMAERYDLCLSHLRDAAEEAEALRAENAQLRVANGELTRCLALLAGKRQGGIVAPVPSSLADEFRRLGVGEETSPTSVLGLQEERFGRRGGEKWVPLPKSISIRSNGFLKLNPGAGSNCNGRMRVPSPIMIGSQRVCVGSGSGGKKGEEEEEEEEEEAAGEEGEGEGGGGALELEVYNQGMFKTELCNKWEERGECPYGDRCQFAHGIAELRPVIRHPRYKTEVCRMVLAGETCPYGHRCHFRHALCPADLLRPSP